MKKMTVLAVLAVFAAGAALAYAADAPKAQPQREDNLFKIVMDSFKPGEVREKNKLKNPLPTVSMFQGMSNGIKEGSEKARGETLRTEASK